MLLRIVLYSTLGLLCNALGFKWDSAEFWSFLGLFWCSDFLARDEGRKEGVAIVLDMHIMKIAALKALMERAIKGDGVTEEDLINELDKPDDKE